MLYKCLSGDSENHEANLNRYIYMFYIHTLGNKNQQYPWQGRETENFALEHCSKDAKRGTG